MKERPIPFSVPMVRAILAGRKSQTRRLVKLPHSDTLDGGNLEAASTFRDAGFGDGEYLHVACNDGSTRRVYCPYADTPGDRLWVREAWRTPQSYDSSSGADLAQRCIAAGYKKPWAPIKYEADGARDNWVAGALNRDDGPGRYRHARFMPRWASRILLEVTDVRVERLQDISEADAIAEGCRCRAGTTVDPLDSDVHIGTPVVLADSARDFYRTLWESINGAGSWEANPWVWVVSFRRVQP